VHVAPSGVRFSTHEGAPEDACLLEQAVAVGRVVRRASTRRELSCPSRGSRQPELHYQAAPNGTSAPVISAAVVRRERGARPREAARTRGDHVKCVVTSDVEDHRRCVRHLRSLDRARHRGGGTGVEHRDQRLAVARRVGGARAVRDDVAAANPEGARVRARRADGGRGLWPQLGDRLRGLHALPYRRCIRKRSCSTTPASSSSPKLFRRAWTGERPPTPATVRRPPRHDIVFATDEFLRWGRAGGALQPAKVLARRKGRLPSTRWSWCSIKREHGSSSIELSRPAAAAINDAARPA